MRHHSPRPQITLGITLFLIVGILAGHFSNAFDPSDGNLRNEVRVTARPLADGRTEVALQRRTDGGWGDRIVPDARFVPADAESGRWLVSSPITLAADQRDVEPLKIAFIQSVGGTDQERRRSFRLAIRHINEAGGVLGQPVIGVIADLSYDSEFAVAVARRLVEEEGVHAVVGPNTSSASLALIEAVIAPHGIPTISPSATAPALTEADDRDFFFRAVPSDSAQGPVLAQLARERGHERVGVVYRDDAWGRGLADAFRSAWSGAISEAVLEPGADSCTAALQRAAAEQPTALVVLTFAGGSALCVGQAVELGLFDRFLFGDAAQSLVLVEELGPEILAGMVGTAAAGPPDNASARFWAHAYAAEHGEAPANSISYIRAVYDATIAIALAAQSARSTDGAAIRDHLRSVADGEGQAYSADQLAQAMRAIRRGEAVDYIGAESSLAWDANGDITRFQIGIWQFSAEGDVEILRRITYDLGD